MNAIGRQARTTANTIKVDRRICFNGDALQRTATLDLAIDGSLRLTTSSIEDHRHSGAALCVAAPD
jgi:hypothetical protein